MLKNIIKPKKKRKYWQNKNKKERDKWMSWLTDQQGQHLQKTGELKQQKRHQYHLQQSPPCSSAHQIFPYPVSWSIKNLKALENWTHPRSDKKGWKNLLFVLMPSWDLLCSGGRWKKNQWEVCGCLGKKSVGIFFPKKILLDYYLLFI